MQRCTGTTRAISTLVVFILLSTSVLPLTTMAADNGGTNDGGPQGAANGTSASTEPIPLYSLVNGPEDSYGFGTNLANVGDVQGDSVQDLLVGSGYGILKLLPPIIGNFTTSTDYLVFGRKDRAFDSSQFEELDNMSSYWTYREQKWLGDVNGDGYDDVVSTASEYTYDGRGGVVQPYISSATLQVRYGTAKGLPKDPDLVIDITPKDLPDNVTTYVSFDFGGVGDVNGDGYNDLLVYRHRIDIYQIPPPINGSRDGKNGSSDGSTGPGTDPKPVPVPTPITYLADIELYYGSKDGLPANYSWNASVVEDMSSQRWSVEVHHADLNGDGCSDVILTSYTAPHVTVYLGSKAGISKKPDTSITFNSNFAYGWRVHAPVRVNGDKYDDMVIDYGTAEGLFKYIQYIYVFEGSARGISDKPTLELKLDSHENARVEMADFNGDGLDDVLIAYSVSSTTSNGVMDVTLQVHFNTGGDYRPAPGWGYTLHDLKEASSISSSDNGDFDGDGFGDVALGIPGMIMYDPTGQITSTQGRVLLLYGAGIMDLLRPLTLVGGPRLFAGYTAYDFRVNANPTGVAQVPKQVWLTLDPKVANVLLTCSIDPAKFTVERDPNHLVRLDSTRADVVPDRENNTVWVHFRVLFGWNWPTEDLCDVIVETSDLVNATVPYRAKELFWVENDLAFYGPLSAAGEWQGPRKEGDWLRVNERVTVSGPVVVYENTTDVYPPSGTCTVVLHDNDGDMATTALSSGAPVNLTISADAATDLSENYTLTLQDLPGNATVVNQPRIHLPVDGDAPTFRNAVPEETDWFSSSEVLVSITADDGNGSGVRAATLEYSASTNGMGAFGPWTRAGLETTSDGPSVDGLVTLTFPDGVENYVKWRAADIVGNGPSESQAYRIRVDTKNVTFTEPFPDSDKWQTKPSVECGVTVTDMQGSGIEVASIEYRVSFMNLSHYGPWTDWDQGAQQDAQSVTARTVIALGESAYNYVQWRAKDIAGNGYTASPHYRVMVDMTPISFYAFRPKDADWQNASRVTCWVNVSDKAGGSGVDLATMQYRVKTAGGTYGDWTPVGMTGVKQDTWFTIVLDLPDSGANFVQLMGSDAAGNGPTVSAEHRIMVDTHGPMFQSISPPADQEQPSTQVAVNVTLRDDLAGLNTSRVWYRWSTVSESDLRTKAWSLIPVEASPLDIFPPQYWGSVALDLVRGKTNFVQFRAQDLLFNANESKVASVWVNQLPTAVIAGPKPGPEFKEDERVLLNATGSSDPDGDALNYTWLAANVTEPLGYGKELLTALPVGVYNVTLVVRDTSGAETRASVLVDVVKLPPPKTVTSSDAALLILLLVVVLIASVGAGYYASKRRQP